MGISSPGIGSNLDINGIVSKLMQAESQPLTILQKKEASYQAQLSAYGTLSGSLSSLQTALGTLNNLSTFQGVNATSADTTIFTASAASGASAGTYNVNITQLAQAQTIATAGQSSTTATIGAGTATKLTFQFGTISGGTLSNGTYSGASFAPDANQATGTVTIDNTNNSLQGIRDAINKANIGVTASIVSDGSATPNHLVIKSNSTGATSSMKISVTAPDGTPGGDATLSSLLAYDPTATQNMTQSAAGQSAALTVNGIAITSATNKVTGAIDGVTLNLAKAGSSNLTVAANTAAVTSAVNGFVKAYNDVNTTIRKLTSYDSSTKQAGLLLGDATVNNIQVQLRKMMASPLTDSSGSLTTLSQVGISIDKSGVMSLDSGKLSSAMSNNMKDVTALFSSIGASTDSLVKYDSATSATTPGDYAVYVSKLATQGNVTGSNVIAAPININSGNKDLALTVNGVSASMSLVEGTYNSASALAAQVQSAINGASAFSSAGIAVSVTIDASGKMVVTSNKYGSDSKVSISGSAVSTILGTTTATDGVDVAGTIGGITATGSGQFLTGALGSATQGLKLQITGGLENASRGTINFSRGYAHLLNGQIDGYLGSSGLLSGRTDGIKRSISDIDKQTEALNNRLADIEARYRKQFTALDVTISKMNSTSTYLTQQLAQISSLSSK
ncbi:MAG: flagellar filament capping protein FliD [Bacillota bacterium]